MGTIEETKKLQNLKDFYGKPAFSIMYLANKQDLILDSAREGVAHDLDNGAVVSWSTMAGMHPCQLVKWLAVELGIPYQNVFVEKPPHDQPEDESKVVFKATVFGARYEVSLKRALERVNWDTYAYINIVAGDWYAVSTLTVEEVTLHLTDAMQRRRYDDAIQATIPKLAIELTNAMTRLPIARGHRGEYKIDFHSGEDISVYLGDIVAGVFTARDFTEREILSARDTVIATLEKESWNKLGWHKIIMP